MKDNPTLSELIVACGEKFSGLMRKGDMASHSHWKKEWHAYAWWKDSKGEHMAYDNEADTPEEAVAKLYLELQSYEK
jgi:hypothetical protein